MMRRPVGLAAHCVPRRRRARGAIHQPFSFFLAPSSIGAGHVREIGSGGVEVIVVFKKKEVIVLLNGESPQE